MSHDEKTVYLSGLAEAIIIGYKDRPISLYSSPEKIKTSSTNITLKSDVWSAGVIVYELSHLRLPFESREVILNKEIKNIV